MFNTSFACFHSEMSGHKQRSFVWDYFLKDVSGAKKCLKCPYTDRSKSSTTTAMVTHLRMAHGIERPVVEERALVAQEEKTKTKLQGIDKFLAGTSTLEEWYTRLVVEDGLSFNQIVTSEFLQRAFSSMGYKAKRSHNTVIAAVNKFIEGIRKKMVVQIKEEFKKGERFSICIDEWTSIRNRRYLNICLLTSTSCNNLGLKRCQGSMTAGRTAEHVQVYAINR